jgi:hypothetical protein
MVVRRATLPPVTLEELTPGARVLGVLPNQPVTVVAVEWHGTQALTLTLKGRSYRCQVGLSASRSARRAWYVSRAM